MNVYRSTDHTLMKTDILWGFSGAKELEWFWRTDQPTENMKNENIDCYI